MWGEGDAGVVVGNGGFWNLDKCVYGYVNVTNLVAEVTVYCWRVSIGVFFLFFFSCLVNVWSIFGRNGSWETMEELKSSASVWLRLEYLATRKLVPRFVGFLAVIMWGCARGDASLLLIEWVVLAACTWEDKEKSLPFVILACRIHLCVVQIEATELTSSSLHET